MRRNGFTLIEILVALVIVGSVALSLTKVMGQFMHTVGTTTSRTVATAVAEESIETIRATPDAAVLYNAIVGTYNGNTTTGFPGYPNIGSNHSRRQDLHRGPPAGGLHDRHGDGHRADHGLAGHDDHRGGRPMNTLRGPRNAVAGFTMIEMLIAMVVLSLVMAATLSLFRSQTQNFRKGGNRMELSQNVRYALGTVERVLRTTGAGTAGSQPMLVYGGNDVIVVNTNFASDIQDGNAVYINPDLPAGAVDGLKTATPITIFGTAINYPAVNYTYGAATGTRAETISFYFQLDATTANANDYILYERVTRWRRKWWRGTFWRIPGARSSSTSPRPPTRPACPSSSRSPRRARRPRQALPIRHSANVHGSGADINGSALADSIRLVRVNMVVTNGQTGTDLASRQISTTMMMPNNGLTQLKSCGDAPVATGALTAVPPGVGGGARLRWARSPDELSGEVDVSQYNVYYRLNGTPDWNTMITVMPTGAATYDITSGVGITSGLTYDFAVAAQDCTPQESPLALALGYLAP